MMAEVHWIPDRERAEYEASQWIVHLAAEDVSPQDRARFQEWLDVHPQNALSYESLSRTWRKLERSGPLVRAVAFGQAMNVASVAPRHRSRWVQAAAAVMGLAIVGLVTAGYWWQRGTESFFRTGVGEHLTASLADGSSLELNSSSEASVELTARARVIHLKRGEAFFQVAHDPERPFWVVAGHSWVRALGTAFNVYLRDSDVQVTVSEGAVQVASGGWGDVVPSEPAPADAAVSMLKAGDQADVGARRAVVRALPAAQLKRSVAWREGDVFFVHQRLGDVVDEMSRYTSLRIEIEDPSLRTLHVDGTFRANPQGAEALLAMLRDGFGLTIRRADAEHVYVEGKPGS